MQVCAPCRAERQFAHSWANRQTRLVQSPCWKAWQIPRGQRRDSRRREGRRLRFGKTPSTSGCEHKCFIEPVARWMGLVFNARSKSAPVRRVLQITEWMGSSSSLAARYPHRDCTYSANAAMRLIKAAVCEAFSGARTRKRSYGEVCWAIARSDEIVRGVELATAARPDGSPVNSNEWRSLIFSWL